MSRSGASKFAVLPDAAVLTHVEPLGHPESYQDAGFDRKVGRRQLRLVLCTPAR